MKKAARHLIIITVLLLTAGSLQAQVDIPPVELKAEIVNGIDSDYLLRVEYVFPPGYHQTHQEDFFKFEISSDTGLSLGKIVYPEGEPDGDSISYYGPTVLQAEIPAFDPGKTGTHEVRAFWQLCDENGLCLFPQSELIVAENNFTTAGAEASVTGISSGIFFFLLLAFAGGLLLNVMPCVLPVLSIKALSLVKQGGEDKKQILKSSLLYTAGVLISLIVLAVVIIIIKTSGEQVGWGFQFQNRGFVLVLLTIIFIFALSLFEVFTISAPVVKTASPVQKQQGSSGSHFFSGVIAVLLATPCTAPFLGTAAGFAFSQSAPVILAIFFFVGLGLAFPFIVIGFIPKLVSKLPKPGAWMNTFREVMGFLLIGTSIWLIDVLLYQSETGFLTNVLIYLGTVTLAAWLYGKLSGPGASRLKRTAGAASAVLLIALSAVFLLSGNDAEPLNPEQNGDAKWAGWLEFSPETVYQYAGGDRPVFVAFGAKWCMTCRTNESTVIFTDEISRFFEENDVVLIHGDYTNKNPEIDRWMRQFGRAGVPFYTWYPAGSSEAVLLPEIITRGMLRELGP